MKKLSLVLSMSSLFVLLAVAPAFGQSRSSHKIQADIPFDFMVSDTTFPAGTYTLSTLMPDVLLIRSLDGHESVVVFTRDVQESLTAPDETKLVFNRFGGQYFLAQVWTVGDVYGREFLKSSTEYEVAKNFSREVLASAG